MKANDNRLNEKGLDTSPSLSNASLRVLVDILNHPAESAQEFLDFALTQAIFLTGSKIGYIYHYNEASQEFTLNTWSKEVMAECKVQGAESIYHLEKTGVWGEAVRQRKPIVMNDYKAESPMKRGIPKGHVEMNNFMTLPIFKRGQIVGVLGLANKSTDYMETDILQVSLIMESIWLIIDQKKSEEELNQSNYRFENLVKRIPVGVYNLYQGVDGTSRFEYISDKFCRMLGFDESELLKNAAIVSERIHPEDKESFYEKNKVAKETLESFVWEGRIFSERGYNWLKIEADAASIGDRGSIWSGVVYDITEQKGLEEEIQQLLIRDQLTGIYNRRKIDQVFKDEKHRVKEGTQNLSVIMADIDHFKRVNDNHGHQVGDAVLTTIAKILKTAIRENDILGRWGGEEFMIICLATELQGAMILAEKLRSKLDDAKMTIAGKQTCSFGVSQLREDENIEAMVHRADAALYRAKRNGRNRVEASY